MDNDNLDFLFEYQKAIIIRDANKKADILDDKLNAELDRIYIKSDEFSKPFYLKLANAIEQYYINLYINRIESRREAAILNYENKLNKIQYQPPIIINTRLGIDKIKIK